MESVNTLEGQTEPEAPFPGVPSTVAKKTIGNGLAKWAKSFLLV